MAYFGLSVNMVTFMFYVMHQPFSSSANAVNDFLGISQASSVLGSFLADAYLGRYWMIAIFTTLYLLGLTGITLCATLHMFTPGQSQCDKLSTLLCTYEQPKPWQMAYLYTVLYITGFGAAVTIGAIIAFTVVVYFQMKYGWGSAFGALAIAMGISNFVFFIGTPIYRHMLPGVSSLTRVAQVLVAAFGKRNIPVSSSDFISLCTLPGKRSASKAVGRLSTQKITGTDILAFYMQMKITNARSNII